MRTYIKLFLKWIFYSAALAALTFFLATNWDSFNKSVSQISIQALSLATLCYLVGTYFAKISWVKMLNAFGYFPNAWQSSKILFTSQIGKYIPGGIWPVVAGVKLGASAGIPGPITALSMSMQLLLFVYSGVILGACTLFFIPSMQGIAPWLLILGIALSGLFLIPRVWATSTRFLLKVLKTQDVRGPNQMHVYSALFWSFLTWSFYGIQWFLLCSPVIAWPLLDSLRYTAGFALAWALGFIAIVMPAGGGVREIVLVTLFSSEGSSLNILSIALISRFISIFVDLVFFLIVNIGHVRRKFHE